MVKESLIQFNSEARIQIPRRGPDWVHTKLADACIDCSNAEGSRNIWADGWARPGVIPDLEYLQLGPNFICDLLKQGGANTVSCTISIRIRLYCDANVKSRRVVI